MKASYQRRKFCGEGVAQQVGMDIFRLPGIAFQKASLSPTGPRNRKGLKGIPAPEPIFSAGCWSGKF
jgi:hypothetical protein